MLTPHEIVLPETKPALEWIAGRAVPKVSPLRPHSLVQGRMYARLAVWAEGRGEVETEWRFRIAPPGKEIRPLVPDIAYLSYERMGDTSDEELEAPLLAPNAAVEVRSPGDRQSDIEHKVAVYLAAGTDVVILIDPLRRTVRAHDRSATRDFTADDSFIHAALPEFTLPLHQVFDVLRRKR